MSMATLGAVLIAVPALAVEPYLPKSPRAFAFLDSNDDGKIVLGEIAPRAGKRLLRYDSDGNGAVSAAELDAIMQKALELRRTRIMTTLDADKDGAITGAGAHHPSTTYTRTFPSGCQIGDPAAPAAPGGNA